jgi:preprotein translocase subunit SecF
VDSQVSKQLRSDGILAVFYSILAIVIYIMLRFDMYFAPGTIFALVNDIMIAMLLFLVFRLEFDAPSIAALLTIVGYSINNTVVVFDRIRETLPSNPKKTLSIEETIPYVNKAINDTLSRTINTTLTTLFSSLAIYIFTNGVIKTFALVLSVGITFGALTSMLVAPAAYILAKKYFHHHDINANSNSTSTYTREDKHKGVV